ncbi:hypothetical protein [Mesobacillus zeae]|uniref:Metalloprotease n=1 Tax=Mesobacillus zeae TaxID=1917180 RepID=A0A398BF81_9BACI|nr:hypothetical protein [Mesobacillus zeae]RID88915.1 hypothetical protein D1970_00955 [Mesobacillus zeae]
MQDIQIQILIESIIENSGTEAKVVLEGDFPGDRFAGGKYQFGTHTITLYIEEIRRQCKKIFGSEDCFFDYLAVVFAHEIGHAEDRELLGLIDRMDNSEDEEERNNILLTIEQNAWEYARTIVPESSSRRFLETIIFHSLQPHYDVLGLVQEGSGTHPRFKAPMGA